MRARPNTRPLGTIAPAIVSVVALEDEPRTIVALSYPAPVACTCAACVEQRGGRIATEGQVDRILGEVTSN